MNASSAGGEPAKTKKKKTKKKKKKKKKKQSIVLNVEGISDPHVCTAVERCLIMAAGVVSVTLETSRGNAIVVARADTTPGDLVTALEDLGLVASIFDQKASTPQGSKPANTLHYLDDEYKAEDHKGAFRFVRFATAPQHIRLTHVPLSLSLSLTHTHTHTPRRDDDNVRLQYARIATRGRAAQGARTRAAAGEGGGVRCARGPQRHELVLVSMRATCLPNVSGGLWKKKKKKQIEKCVCIGLRVCV